MRRCKRSTNFTTVVFELWSIIIGKVSTSGWSQEASPLVRRAGFPQQVSEALLAGRRICVDETLIRQFQWLRAQRDGEFPRQEKPCSTTALRSCGGSRNATLPGLAQGSACNLLVS